MAISRLEKRLGARLLQRTTRKVVLTDEGAALLSRSERLMEDFDDILDTFQQAENTLSGRLRVDVPLGMAAGMLMRALPDFLDRHPDLKVDVFSTDRRVDVIAEGFDCVVRVGPIVDDSLVCRPLGFLPLVNVASASYLDRCGTPEKLADLANHDIIHYAPNASGHAAQFDYLEAGVSRGLAMSWRVTVNNSAAYQAACRAGFGIAQLPLLSIQSGLESGELVRILHAHEPAAMPINLLYPHRRNTPRRVRMFGDWMCEVIKTSMHNPVT